MTALVDEAMQNATPWHELDEATILCNALCKTFERVVSNSAFNGELCETRILCQRIADWTRVSEISREQFERAACRILQPHLESFSARQIDA